MLKTKIDKIEIIYQNSWLIINFKLKFYCTFSLNG